MIRLVLGRMVGLPGDIFIKRGDFFKQLLLVVLGSKMVMRASLLDVSGQLTLGQQGIGRDGFSFDIEAVKERYGNFYFVCSLFLIASFYWQTADFFWV